MARDYSIWRTTIATLGIFAATTLSAPLALAQYTWVQDNNGNDAWHLNTRWTPTGIPNAADATALLNMPLTTTPAGNGYTLNINEFNTTVGSLTLDNSAHLNNHVTRICGAANCTGQLIFQSTSGTATYTETAGTEDTDLDGRFIINPGVTLLSNLIFTQDNQPNLNTSTEFTNVVTAASDITFTKEGVGNLQFTNNVSLFSGEGFLGQYVINEGAIRLIGRAAIRNSAGVTVNAGGQLQLADNNATSIPDWFMETGAVLNLNGEGKASGIGADGALRIGITTGRTTTFHHPVVLQSDSVINVAQVTTTGILNNVVSGPGDLIMMSSNATGTLSLTNSGNSYTGDTDVRSGILSITNPYLANAADVYLTTGATFNLDFSGTDVVDSLFIDGLSQAEGTWGAVGNALADFESALITGTGLLDVSTFVTPGLTGDYNDDGIVDAADYVTWRANQGTMNELPNDPVGGEIGQTQYDNWTANFGASEAGGGSSLGAVPEPASLLLLVAGLTMLGGCRRR